MAREKKIASLKPSGARVNDVALVFDDMGAFVDHCQAMPRERRLATPTNDWVDHLSFDDACRVARNGDLSRVARLTLPLTWQAIRSICAGVNACCHRQRR
jgi:hypothetical protein